MSLQLKWATLYGVQCYSTIFDQLKRSFLPLDQDYCTTWAVKDEFAADCISPLMRRVPEAVEGYPHAVGSRCDLVRGEVGSAVAVPVVGGLLNDGPQVPGAAVVDGCQVLAGDFGPGTIRGGDRKSVRPGEDRDAWESLPDSEAQPGLVEQVWVDLAVAVLDGAFVDRGDFG